MTRWPDRSAEGDVAAQLAAARWVRTWDTYADQQRHARVHRGEAAALHAEYEEACRPYGLATSSVSPIQRYAIGGGPTATGVAIHLSRYAGTPDALMAELRCHRAWMMMGPVEMDACPLDLPGLAIEARGQGDAVTLTISVDGDAARDELQRRTARDLEDARRRRDRAHE